MNIFLFIPIHLSARRLGAAITRANAASGAVSLPLVCRGAGVVSLGRGTQVLPRGCRGVGVVHLGASRTNVAATLI
eukprot:851183-Pyramimonas_sp.AAC.1